MTRRVDHALILTGQEAAILWHAADLNELRVRSRSNPALYSLLVDLYKTALSSAPSDTGSKKPVKREIDETENTEFLTVTEVAKRAGVTSRTIRNDIGRELIRATRIGREWVITRPAAEAYIAGRRPA